MVRRTLFFFHRNHLFCFLFLFSGFPDSAAAGPEEEEVIDVTNSEEFISDPLEDEHLSEKQSLFQEEIVVTDPFASPKPNSSAHKLFARPPEGDGKLDDFIHAFDDEFGSDTLDNLRKLGGGNCDIGEFATE